MKNKNFESWKNYLIFISHTHYSQTTHAIVKIRISVMTMKSYPVDSETSGKEGNTMTLWQVGWGLHVHWVIKKFCCKYLRWKLDVLQIGHGEQTLSCPRFKGSWKSPVQ
jgi:hypothetical protein